MLVDSSTSTIVLKSMILLILGKIVIHALTGLAISNKP